MISTRCLLLVLFAALINLASSDYLRNTLLTVKHEMTSSTKTVTFLRHSTTENNEYMRQHSPRAWGGDVDFFKDPGLRDTELSSSGLSLVTKLNQRLTSGEALGAFDRASSIDLVAVSPLRRTLQTATIGLDKVLFNAEHDPKKVVCPLAAERLYMEADVGRPRSVLEKEFPMFDYDSLPKDDSAWWYTERESDSQPDWRPPGDYLCRGEPKDVFGNRMIALKQWLAERPEANILLVAHWGTINSLTGKQFENCEIGSFQMSQLLSDDEILRANV